MLLKDLVINKGTNIRHETMLNTTYEKNIKKSSPNGKNVEEKENFATRPFYEFIFFVSADLPPKISTLQVRAWWSRYRKAIQASTN